MSAPSDETLLRLVREGDNGAFDLLVDRYGRRILAFGLRMCGHHHDAEDVFQETLIAAYGGLSEIRDPKAVRTWLFKVASNHCLMRRRRDQPNRNVSLEEMKAPAWDQEGYNVEGITIPPVDAAERAELRRMLERALGSLDSEHRMVVILRDLEGFSTRETADIMDLSLSAVKMRLHRARLSLREALSAYHPQVA